MAVNRRSFRSVLSAGLSAVVTGLLLSAAAPASAAPTIAPHIAVYKLSLSKSKGTRSVVQAAGRIEFKWVEGCDGWTISQRTELVLTDPEGADFLSGWTMDTWESRDGLSYRFSIRRVQENTEPVVTRGKARLEGPGLGGQVRYSAPEGRWLDLPAGTVFPTRHSLDLLAAAARDEVLMWRTVFDGAGDEGLFGVNAAIAQAIPAGTLPSFDSSLIAAMPSWRMRLAFFGSDEQEAEPEHEQGQRIYANGVVDELEFDYSDFALKGSLERLEALPPPDCS